MFAQSSIYGHVPLVVCATYALKIEGERNKIK